MSGARSGADAGPGRRATGREAAMRYVRVVDDGRLILDRPVSPAYVMMEKYGTHGVAVNLAMVAEAVFDVATARRGEGAEVCYPRATVHFAVPGAGGVMDRRVYEGEAAMRIRRAIELLAAGVGMDEAQRVAGDLGADRVAA